MNTCLQKNKICCFLKPKWTSRSKLHNARKSLRTAVRRWCGLVHSEGCTAMFCISLHETVLCGPCIGPYSFVHRVFPMLLRLMPWERGLAIHSKSIFRCSRRHRKQNQFVHLQRFPASPLYHDHDKAAGCLRKNASNLPRIA